MNNLSWFIYLTQIVDNLATACWIVLGVGGITVVFTPLIIMMLEDYDNAPSIRTIFRCWAVVMVCSLIGGIVTPSRQTMVMIAGSELGERVAKSESVNSIVNPGMDLIRKWIKQEADKIKDKS